MALQAVLSGSASTRKGEAQRSIWGHQSTGAALGGEGAATCWARGQSGQLGNCSWAKACLAISDLWG